MSIPTLNQKVLDFCNTNRGSSVGTGECWDLAELALADAGARTSTQIMGPTAVSRANADYIWGTPTTLRDIKPGDIIQYKNFVVDTDVTAADGSGYDQQTSLPHHTAIVAEVYPRGKVKVWEQNNLRNNRPPLLRIVIQNTIHLKSVNYTDPAGNRIQVQKRGRIKIYRPSAPAPARSSRRNKRRRNRRP